MDKKREKVIKSLIEFEKKYFPKKVEKRKIEKLRKSHTIGIIWANETMQKVRGIIEE